MATQTAAVRLAARATMTLTVRPGMTVPLPGPAAQPSRQARRAGRPRVHRHLVGRVRRRRRVHAAGAGRGVGAAPAARHGDRARLHAVAGVPGPVRGLAGRRRARALRDRHRLVEQRDRRALERRAVRRAVQEGPRRRAVPARRAAAARRSPKTYDTFEIQGFRLGVRPEQAPPILVAALREGMLRLAGREADGAIINWLSADDVTTVAGVVHDAAGGARTRDRGPDLRVPERRTPRWCGRVPGSRSRPTSTCPVYAAFHDWLGRGEHAAGRCGTPGRPATARRRWRRSPTRWWTT